MLEVKHLIHPLKITSTMADETRYLIYEHMLKNKRAFTVQEIAETFEIHPNVARHHLTKLAEINVISADFFKTGKGGRPGRVYKIREEGVQLSFPKRDESQLLDWLIEATAQAGEEMLEIAKRVAFEQGKKSIMTTTPHYQELTTEQRMNLLEEQAALIGYVIRINADNGPFELQFNVFNCPFHTQITEHAAIVCALHENYLRGQVELLFPNTEFKQVKSMLNNCHECQYTIG